MSNNYKHTRIWPETKQKLRKLFALMNKPMTVILDELITAKLAELEAKA